MSLLQVERLWCAMAGFRGICSIGGVVVMVLVMVVGLVSAVPLPAPDLPENCNSEERCCMPRPYTGRPVRQFGYDPALPVRVRRAAHLLDEEYIAKLERGVRLQRELPDSDPRSWRNQMNLHCLYCDNGLYYPNQTWPLEIHGGWLFLPWHRMFVYFNERILAKLLGDDAFALPFWNWDNQTPEAPHANILPYFYARNKSSSLWNQNRNNCSEPPLTIDLNTAGGCTAKSPAELRAQNDKLMYTQLVSGAPTANLFFGLPYRLGDAGASGSGTFEDNPHGTVHLWLGDPNPPSPSTPYDDMGNFAVAARDPAFYGLHSNIDRIWTIWKSLPGPHRTEPSHPDFLDAQFTFYDENADLIIVNISQTLNRTLLRYPIRP
jgi:polyphenol oxidase